MGALDIIIAVILAAFSWKWFDLGALRPTFRWTTDAQIASSAQGWKASLDAVAKDGIQLKVKARVTVRTNIDRLVGGAGEETIIARVGEGMVSTIGSSASHCFMCVNGCQTNCLSSRRSSLVEGGNCYLGFEGWRV